MERKLILVALLAFYVGGCGSTVLYPGEPYASDASLEDRSKSDAAVGAWDATFPPFEAGPPFDAGLPPDGGPAPVVSCVTDGGVACPLPASVCLDAYWLRYYTSGTCGDAGTCDFGAQTMRCPSSPTPSDCFQGGCRLVLVR